MKVITRLIALAISILPVFPVSLTAYTASAGQEETANGITNRLILLKFSDTATAEEIESVKQHFCALGRSLAGLEKAVWVEDQTLCSSSDYTHAVLLTFSCAKTAETYRQHSECQEFEKEAPGVVASLLEMKYRLCAENVSGPAS